MAMWLFWCSDRYGIHRHRNDGPFQEEEVAVVKELPMCRLIVTWMALLWITPSVSIQSPAGALSNQVGELLRTRIEAAGFPPKIAIGEEVIHASIALPLFYERRIYAPAWSGDNGPLPQVDALLKAIREADQEGLRPGDYHLSRIEATLREVRQNREERRPLNPGSLVDLDLLLTDAFLIYGSHLLAGRINPETIDPEWHANRREADLALALQSALESDRIEEGLKRFLPPQGGYARLRQALARYREISAKGGWPVVAPGPKIAKGDRSDRVEALRARLVATGDLHHRLPSEGDVFDEALAQAVLRFQRRHGLEMDGVVGRATLVALNVPAVDRIRQIEVNMERWRWLPQDLGPKYILVNIANFELDVVEGAQKVIMMRVVVGRDYRRTPVFSDKMTYLVLSPYWHVPPSIAVQDLLPLVHEDPDYLASNNIKVFSGWGAGAKEVDPRTINWSRVTPQNLNYRFRQEPGPTNVLGRVKFMFPNKFNVYLHDTPWRELFAETERTFSSGCIRVEKAIELAEYVVRGDPRWTRESILAEIEKRVEQTVRLPKPVPVHLLYWTVWADGDGSVHFRNDIYGRDRLLYEALGERPPMATDYGGSK